MADLENELSVSRDPAERDSWEVVGDAVVSDAQRMSVARGGAWLGLAAVLGRVANFASQIVVGIVLVQEDLGLYAIAVGVAGVVQVLKDGGVRKAVVQRGSGNVGPYLRSGLRLGTMVNCGLGLLTVALGPLVAKWYGLPGVEIVLALIGVGAALGTPETIYRAWLNADLRFRELAILNTAVAVGRSLATIGGLLLGMGVASLGVAFVVGPCVGWAVGRRFCGPFPPLSSAKAAGLLWSTGRWLVVGSAAATLLRQGPFLVWGATESAALVGTLFFAFQLLLQLNVVLSLSGQAVVLPTLSRAAREPGRARRSVLTTLDVTAVLGCAAALAVGSSIVGVEQAIWQGKWSESARVVQVLAFFFPFRLMIAILEAVMLALNRARLWALVATLQSLTVVVTAALAGSASEDPLVLAGAVGAALALTTLAEFLLVERVADLRPGVATRRFLFYWGIAAVSAGVGWLILGAAPSGADTRMAGLFHRGLVPLVGSMVPFGVVVWYFRRDLVKRVLSSLHRERQ